VKAAVISRLIRESYADRMEELLIHTGQHYDKNMSELFFREMRIPEPDINLGLGGGTHGAMTGRMLEKLEKILIDSAPEYVLVYGDTNSTLAGALAASKLHIPVAHVEAGLRSFNREMPEEINRVLTDHMADVLFCPTDTAVENLKTEGITKGVHRTGDIMLDASLFYRTLPHSSAVQAPEQFFLATLHRAENTDDPERLRSIVDSLNIFTDLPGILPLHPRTRKMMEAFGLSFASHIKVIDPIGYLDMIDLENRCKFIVTDSGGVQKEAFFFQKPCVTLRDQTEWVETVQSGANQIVGADSSAILDALRNPPMPKEWPNLYGDGTSAESIVEALLNS